MGKGCPALGEVKKMNMYTVLNKGREIVSLHRDFANARIAASKDSRAEYVRPAKRMTPNDADDYDVNRMVELGEYLVREYNMHEYIIDWGNTYVYARE